MASKPVLMDKHAMEDPKPLTGALKALSGAEVVTYMPMNAYGAQRLYGLVAQSIEKKAPHAVEADGLGNLYVRPDGVLYLLVGAVDELSKKVSKLEKVVSELEVKPEPKPKKAKKQEAPKEPEVKAEAKTD